MPDDQSRLKDMNDDVAEIIREGEAGVGTAMQVLEATERTYFGALAATTTSTPITTTTSTG
jgi:hypothetical protein